MKKNILSSLMLVLLASTFASCEKDLMEYEGEDSLFFDVRRGAEWIDPVKWAHQFYSPVEFGNIEGDETDLSITVRTTGDVKDYDREFKVIIVADSTEVTVGEAGAEGVEVSGFKDTYVIKAGEDRATIDLKFHRTPELDGDTLRLQLALLPNEHFVTKFGEYGDYPSTYKADDHNLFGRNKNANIHNIYVYDVLSRPSGWFGNDETGAGLFGKFTAKKYRFMMEFMNLTVEDFTKENMPSQRANAIAESITIELLKRARAHDPLLDEDGTMMYFMPIETLGGDDAWKPFTKPEDYYAE